MECYDIFERVKDSSIRHDVLAIATSPACPFPLRNHLQRSISLHLVNLPFPGPTPSSTPSRALSTTPAIATSYITTFGVRAVAHDVELILLLIDTISVIAARLCVCL